MDHERDAKILETVIEELETEKGKTKFSRVQTEQLTKSSKVSKTKTGGKQKKCKRSEIVIEKESEETKTIVVEIPLTEEEKNKNESTQQADAEYKSVKNTNELPKFHIANGEKEPSLAFTVSLKQYCETNTGASITEQVTINNAVTDNVKGSGKSEHNKLFTRVFSLKNKETNSSEKDFIITPNPSENGTHKSDGVHNKENKMDKEASTLSQEFVRSNSDKSILTTRSEPHGKCMSKPFPKRLRPMSTSALSKKALEAYLPRKSFFSSHDRVLREAGYQVDDAMKNKKRPNWRLILRMHTEEELNPDFGSEPEKTIVKELQIKEESDDDGEETLHLVDAVETLMSQEKDGQPSKRRLKLAAKKLGMEEKCDYKQLLDYLKYINDHPEEYMNMARYSSKNMDYKHPSVMVRMARVFRKAHHGTARNNIFTHALAGLKPKIADPQTQQRHGRGEHGRNEFGAVKKDQTDGPQEQTNSPQEEGKTEIEKLKFKTEKWMGGLTTMQILKAKELALKDMGEEDITVTKWWLAFKTCNYLRIPPTVLEQAQ